MPKIYPFNPNFITDFKGYKLGMSVAEIDRLLAFRKTNRYVNSAEEFQQVTLISDSLLKTMSPYFKFPDWVTGKKNKQYVDYSKSKFDKKPQIVMMDINEATQEDLIKIYGIGPALSERILKEKAKYGAFMSMEQMEHIWGLSPEVIENLNKHFHIKTIPNIDKVKINTASIKELSQFPYFRYALAREIVVYRSMNGDIKVPDDLKKIKGFPIEKVNIIEKYLEY
ncbi:helix-hairpin-helix domain-containing protein [Flavobacterium nitrogenifigens]|uniref:ComEA family DNA-binding protein n=1 Tax=Flavobacterium nitrogenifigens TaxID=1617283 RepID=UPI0031AD052F